VKVNRLETHDRLEHFKKDQSVNIWQGADDCLKKNPLSLALQERSPYIYIFAHPRTADDGLTKRMLWQPRLSRPPAQSNSYLFRAQSHTDIVEICWLIPDEMVWDQFKAGNVVEDNTIAWSIEQFRSNKKKLEAPLPDDLPNQRIKLIYQEIADGMKPKANLLLIL